MDAMGFVMLLVFVGIMSLPFLARGFKNKHLNVENEVTWTSSFLSYGGRTVYYKDVDTVAFLILDDRHYTNFVKNDDTISYYIKVNDIEIGREHSAFNRASSESKQQKDDIVSEYRDILGNITNYIIPELLKKKIGELVSNGKIIVGGVTLTSGKEFIYQGNHYRVSDISLDTHNGAIFVYSNTEKTLLGKAKQICSISMAIDNVCLIAPIVSLLRSNRL
jgi:hypothetical protein